MSFLAPWFLLGGLAIAGPILFHLIRRAARERMPFSSLMFLRPTPPRMTRRRKIEHFWLLLLRCLCLLLLATGFARPFFIKDPAGPAPADEGRQLVLLLDTSASMRRAGLWDKARATAQKYLDATALSDRVAIMAFDRQPRTLVSFSQWSAWSVDQRPALARQQIAAATPGWMGTQLGLALTAAAEQLLDESSSGTPATRRELVLITDLQEGARLDGLQGHDWPAGVKVTVEQVESAHGNAGLTILRDTAGTRVDTPTPQVRISNSRDSNREKFQLGWVGNNSSSFAGNASEIYLPPGQTRTFAAPQVPSEATQLRLTGDEEDFDNTTWYTPPEIDRVQIVYAASDLPNDPATLRYYLQRVFLETPRRKVEFVTPGQNSRISPEALKSAGLIVVPALLSTDETAAVRAAIVAGKTALLVVTGTSMAPTLAGLCGVPEVQLTESAGNYALLGDIDFGHPLFAPFADPRFSDFTQIHFWKHRRWEIASTVPARVLAKFDDGSVALVQVPVGKGQLLVLTAGWHPADSQLAVASKFPPLMQSLLEWSRSASPATFQFTTGDAIPSPASAGDAAVQWRKPDGSTVAVAAGTAFVETLEPGIYSASVGNQDHRFAVDLPLDESRTAPISPDELARLGVPLQAETQVSAARLQQQQRYLHYSELENRQKIWRWLLAVVLVLTLGEILLGGWLARRIKPAEAAP